MSPSVGAFSSKSRLMNAANWSSVWNTEKSSSGKKLNGKTMRPYRLITNGFMASPSALIVPDHTGRVKPRRRCRPCPSCYAVAHLAWMTASRRLDDGGDERMARIEGVDPARPPDDYTAKVLEAQAKTRGAPLLNHLVYARRPSIFRGARGMWTGIDGSGLIDGRLAALLNRRVAPVVREGVVLEGDD